MSNNRQEIFLSDLPTDIFTYAMPTAGISEQQTMALMRTLSRTCIRLHSFFQTPLNNYAVQVLSQAVIDDDRELIKKILNGNPKILLLTPNVVIESKLTWQKFYPANPLAMAVKRKQIKMIQLLLSYYDKLPQTEAVQSIKNNALTAWSRVKINDETKIIIPQEYTSYMQSLIDLFIQANIPDPTITLNEDSESALDIFRQKLLSREPIKLDHYPDVELLLLAAYQTYLANQHAFQSWNQAYAFCIRVIGSIQSVLNPETAKIFCEGICNVVKALDYGKDLEISELAKKHKLKGGQSFYRTARDSQHGPGFDYFWGILGLTFCFPSAELALHFDYLAKIYIAKATAFEQLTAYKSSCCTII